MFLTVFKSYLTNFRQTSVAISPDIMNSHKNNQLITCNNVDKHYPSGDQQLVPQNSANNKQMAQNFGNHAPLNFKQQHLCEGDILELNFNGNTEYMIFLGRVGTKENVLYAVCDTIDRNTPPTLFQRLWGGAKHIEEKSFSQNTCALAKNPIGYTNNEIQHIAIRQSAIDELLPPNHYSIKVNNFDHVNLEPNNPTAILDRALFKVTDHKASPHFQNSKDWVIWCRYGRDIITKVYNIPSQFDFAAKSGKY